MTDQDLRNIDWTRINGHMVCATISSKQYIKDLDELARCAKSKGDGNAVGSDELTAMLIEETINNRLHHAWSNSPHPDNKKQDIFTIALHRIDDYSISSNTTEEECLEHFIKADAKIGIWDDVIEYAKALGGVRDNGQFNWFYTGNGVNWRKHNFCVTPSPVTFEDVSLVIQYIKDDVEYDKEHHTYAPVAARA